MEQAHTERYWCRQGKGAGLCAPGAPAARAIHTLRVSATTIRRMGRAIICGLAWVVGISAILHAFTVPLPLGVLMAAIGMAIIILVPYSLVRAEGSARGSAE